MKYRRVCVEAMKISEISYLRGNTINFGAIYMDIARRFRKRRRFQRNFSRRSKLQKHPTTWL
jgi:hypothetical protein